MVAKKLTPKPRAAGTQGQTRLFGSRFRLDFRSQRRYSTAREKGLAAARKLKGVKIRHHQIDPMIPPAPDPALVDRLVLANRILHHQGIVDSFGHVSVRHDKAAGHFLLARNMAPGLVRRADIVTFDLDG